MRKQPVTQSSNPATQSATDSKQPIAWNDGPIQKRLFALIALSMMLGVMLATLIAQQGYPIAPLLLGFTLFAALLMSFGYAFIIKPINDLHHHFKMIERNRRPQNNVTSLISRNDEVGQIARLANQLAQNLYQDRTDASQLRRTLDDKVEKMTRRATIELRKQALRDPMTGLSNRRFLDTHIDDMFNACRFSNTELICMMIDMDHFKQVNDTLGHASGDELIKFTALLLKAAVRGDDWVVRLGGDEFLIIMPGISVDRAGEIALQMIKQFKQKVTITLPQHLHCSSLSIGIASLHQHQIKDAKSLIEKADANLYQAKQGGRAQCTS